jgi:putative transposase
VLDGASREDAATIDGMARQTLRDWVTRFNEQGPDGLINIPSPGMPPKLDDTHRAFLRLYEEFGLSVSDDTIDRALKDLGFSHVSASVRSAPNSELARRWCYRPATPKQCSFISTRLLPRSRLARMPF